MSIRDWRLQEEIERLMNCGWNVPKDYGCSISCLSRSIASQDVSFPSLAYELDSKNQDLDYFWANYRATRIFDTLREFGQDMMWEIGSGDGSAAIPLTKLGQSVICVEPLHNGAMVTRNLGIPTFCGKLEDFDIPNYSLPSVGLFDVIEHIEDTTIFLDFIALKLSNQGLLFLTVPMYPWLFSDFDISVGHFRRYTFDSVGKELAESGFEIVKYSYLFSFLVIPALFTRRIPFLLGRRQEYEKVHRRMNLMLRAAKYFSFVISILTWLEMKINPKFGLSLLIVARKIDRNTL